MKRFRDSGTLIVVLRAVVTLSGASVFVCPTARAGEAGHTAHTVPAGAPPALHGTPTEASITALTLDVDDDGNELLEHWGDPKYAAEERLQTAGLLSLMAVGSTLALGRRLAMRRREKRG